MAHGSGVPFGKIAQATEWIDDGRPAILNHLKSDPISIG
jgi:hypothetical protein